MTLNIYNSPEDCSDNIPFVYYQKEYFQAQTYANFRAYHTSAFFMAIDIINDQAISIPRSPFGSILSRDDKNSLSVFLESVSEDLKRMGVNTLRLNHPIQQYSSLIESKMILKSGGNIEFEDLNQIIDLNENWQSKIHQMQRRKLNTLKEEGFYFRKMNANEWETAYKFLVVCRQAQGVQINISWDQLNKLVQTLPEAYDCFGVFRDDKISALCIAVNVTTEIAYYYLPATSPLFRTHSPMVLLIAGMVEYYRDKKFKYLDLGVSSVEGKPQETLMKFKERMGAVTVKKPTFKLTL